MSCFVGFAGENVNVEELLHLACQAVVFGALREKVKNEGLPPFHYGVAAFAFALRSKAKAGSVMNLLQLPALNHRCEVMSGVLQQECAAILQDFFRKKRALSADEPSHTDLQDQQTETCQFFANRWEREIANRKHSCKCRSKVI